MEYFRKKWTSHKKISLNNKPKIVFVNRKTTFTQPGGDTVQILKTKEYLEKEFDMIIPFCTTPEEMLLHEDADIFHIFNIQTVDETEKFVATAKDMGKTIAISPIYWDLNDGTFIYYISKLGIFTLYPWMKKYPIFTTKLVNYLARIIKGTRMGYLSSDYVGRVSRILRLANILLPNSEEEMQILIKHFNVEGIKYRAVPNAIEQVKYDASIYNRNPHRVLVAGRIETGKNQLSVIKALYNDKDIEIVFIGRNNNPRYYNYLKSLASQRGNVIFIDEVPHDEMEKYYSSAAVHVLPSFRESPGLVTLEALYYGCSVVVSDSKYAPVEYYDLDKVGYLCDPYDYSSIRRAILDAIHRPKVYDRERFFERINYKTAAEETYLAYGDILRKNSYINGD